MSLSSCKGREVPRRLPNILFAPIRPFASNNGKNNSLEILGPEIPRAWHPKIPSKIC
jgi:hypothetical protein